MVGTQLVSLWRPYVSIDALPSPMYCNHQHSVPIAAAAGEHWDDTITMDTYYNPVPHFGFKHALAHSPQLRSVPLQPKPINEKDPFGPGLDDL